MSNPWVWLAIRLGWIPQHHVELHEETSRQLHDVQALDERQNARLDAIEDMLRARAMVRRREGLPE